ncbi:hypothetical protein HDU84_001938 [Entophlyctis sp. JEL0112]|nr:hypothetical protein HDU84_001938 [Entophlyctis sp. JEL0112]
MASTSLKAAFKLPRGVLGSRPWPVPPPRVWQCRAFSSSSPAWRRLAGSSSTYSFSRTTNFASGSSGGTFSGTSSTFPWAKAFGAVAAVGVGAVAIDKIFNSSDAYNHGVVSDFDTLATNVYVREYLNETFRYVGGALVLTAASAFLLHRNYALQSMMMRHPIAMSVGGLVVTVGAMFGTLNTHPSNTTQKHILFATFAVAKGAMLSPLFFLNPAVLARAGLYTAAIVGSLSYIAATSKSDRFLYMGGPLFAGLCIVALSSLSTIFLHATSAALPFLHSLSLYGGLAVFGGFVLYDTQKVIKHGQLASQGAARRDPVNESIGLYLDFINIFVRLVQILSMSGSGNRRK